MKALLLMLLLLPSIASATLFEDFADHYKQDLIFMSPPNLYKVDMADEDEPVALCFMIQLKSEGNRPFQIFHRDGVIEKIFTPIDETYPQGEVNPEQLMRASTI